MPDDQADEIETTAEAVPPRAAGLCEQCDRPAQLCETHAGALVAQAFSEEASNRREGAGKAAERQLRKGAREATHAEDATALRLVITRWWGDESSAVARLIVGQLEQEASK